MLTGIIFPEHRARLGLHTRPASTVAADGGTSAAAPAPAAAATGAPAAPDYQCTAGTQRHLVCYCCMEPFPSRTDPDLPATACECYTIRGVLLILLLPATEM